MMECIFPNNTVYMNGKGRDITPERHGSISSLLRQLVSENEIEIDFASYAINGTPFSLSHARSQGLCPQHVPPQNQSHSLLSRSRLSLREHLWLLLASRSSSRTSAHRVVTRLSAHACQISLSRPVARYTRPSSTSTKAKGELPPTSRMRSFFKIPRMVRFIALSNCGSLL